ncbi:hypothetical protein [Ottowia sp.]|uniref:hypothetical protein n=1 Tax=Ottowia sp. TaxID=1898956 RepID=UPI003A8BE2F0
MSSERDLMPNQQAVVDWLAEVADQGSVGAYAGGAEQFRRDLMQRLDALPVRVPNQTSDAVTLLYSGPLGDQVRGGWEIAESIGRQSGGQVVTIGETPLGGLQNHRIFSEALKYAVGSDHAHLHTELMDGVRADGSRVESVWDRGSRRLAMAAEGDVRTLTPSALDGKVFASVELPALLDNPNVSHVNGVPVEAYRHIYQNTPGTVPDKLSRVNEAVQASSYELTREMRWREIPDTARGAGHFDVDTGQLFEGTPYRSTPHVPADKANFNMRQGDPSLTPEQHQRMASGQQHLGQALEQIVPDGNPHGLRIRAGTVLKGLGLAGTAYGLYEGYGEFRDAVDNARSTRDLHVNGAEAAADLAVRGGVSGVAAAAGGAVGGAAGTLVAPGPGTVGGALVAGGAAAYGAERAYEDSRVQQWAKALGREAGEISYDYFSKEGRLLRRMEGLKTELAELTDGPSAERQRVQRELGVVGEAFKAEADRNNAYFEGRGQIDAQWQALSERFPKLDKDDVVQAYEQRFEAAKTTPDPGALNQTVRGAYSDAVHSEVQTRALPYVPEVDYRQMDERALKQAWHSYSGEVSQGQHAIDELQRSGPTSSKAPLIGGWLGQRRHDNALESLRDEHWRDSGHQSTIEATLHERGLALPNAEREAEAARAGRADANMPAPTLTLPQSLGPISRQLVSDSVQAVSDVASRHGLAWDQGMVNTAYSVAAQARAAGMDRVNLFHAADSTLRAGQYDGIRLQEVTLDNSVAANTPQAKSHQQMQALDAQKDLVPEQARIRVQTMHEQPMER